ncbi:MAG: ChbG/HpnK family deacetylase [Candidatus Omnitrophica bacterium]|nr:ChbG/HpnK family deacetylase [Candidatus Omnitrophota bacterium]
MKQLIVTADDFGLSKSISEDIAKACREGIVTSINLLSTGRSFEESLYLIKDLKLEEIGAHLSLTGTIPATYPGQIPTLIAKNGRFHKSYRNFFINLFLKKINREEVDLELRNQLERLKRIGIPITNLTSHEHIHMMPELLNIFVDLAKEYRIPFIRYPRGDKLVRPLRGDKFFRLSLLSLFGKNMGHVIERSGLRATDHFIGFLDSGNLNEEVLIRLLNKLEDGTTEMVCHPGCEGELAALTARRVKKFIQDNGIVLTTFKNILSEKKQK